MFERLSCLFITVRYSEFGLIVGGLAFKMGWMSGDILVAVAIAVSLSFLIAAPLNRAGAQALSAVR